MTLNTGCRKPGPALLVALSFFAFRFLNAQVVPNAAWRTIHTPHFSVHFTPPVEMAARRAAIYTERAYAKLASRLVAPRGPIDLVVADNVDYSNGSTTPFPSNRIIIYTHPALDTPSLRFYDDWLELVITHELTHTFQLDRAGGWWGAAQKVFGRAVLLFPNFYQPAWVLEGLATYEESAVTGTGRVQSSYERMLLAADLTGGGLPRLDEWNLTTSRYPGGELAYAYGSLFFDYLERRRPGGVRDYVERASRAPIPFLLNRAASRSFGVSFSQAWRDWRDSLARGAHDAPPPLPMWRDLTAGGRVALFPRWADSASLILTVSDGESATHAQRTNAGGVTRALGRRNSVDAGSVRADGAIVFAQLDRVDPYRIYSDLYLEVRGESHRLTHRARLSQPDVRADGEIVAIQTVAGSARLVRVSRDGVRVTPLSEAALDTAFTEPRWSPRGDRIAVTRWTRGGYADVVIVDSLGTVQRALTHDRAFDASPSWSPDGRLVFFSSDRDGVNELYMVALDAERGTLASEPRLLARATTGAFQPSLSPDGRTLAAVRYAADGYHAGTAPFDSAHARPVPIAPALDPPPLEPVASSDAPAAPYSPWSSLVPRYWLPLIGQTSNARATVGAITSGRDIVGRHAYIAQALFDLRGDEHEGSLSYRYAGFGQPYFDIGAAQRWDRTGIDSGRTRIGDLRRRGRLIDASLTVERPRFRTFSYLSVGGELEQREYSTQPSSLLRRLSSSFYRSRPQYRSLVVNTGWSNAQRPALAISLEDGVALSLSGRLRWIAADSAYRSNAVTAALNAYKSLDVGGFAHHVLALRAAGAYASGRIPGDYSVGGSSGEIVTIAPGITTGGRRAFFVRGFPPDAKTGTRVVSGSAEYRAPLVRPDRGLGLLPIFLSRTSVALFADAGAASDASFGRDSWIASAGAELNLDAALQFDYPYRIRLGVAAPVVDHSDYATRKASVYVLFGSSF
ncbi:MAG: hypothetical protein ABJD07_09775 [Gemmatimonadaceae bacterium]